MTEHKIVKIKHFARMHNLLPISIGQHMPNAKSDMRFHKTN